MIEAFISQYNNKNLTALPLNVADETSNNILSSSSALNFPPENNPPPGNFFDGSLLDLAYQNLRLPMESPTIDFDLNKSTISLPPATPYLKISENQSVTRAITMQKWGSKHYKDYTGSEATICKNDALFVLQVNSELHHVYKDLFCVCNLTMLNRFLRKNCEEYIEQWNNDNSVKMPSIDVITSLHLHKFNELGYLMKYNGIPINSPFQDKDIFELVQYNMMGIFMGLMRFFGSCAYSPNDAAQEDRNNFYINEVNFQKSMYITATVSLVGTIWNYWGEDAIDGSRLYFIVKRLKENNYAISIVPWTPPTRSNICQPTMEDLKYEHNGLHCYGHAIFVGTVLRAVDSSGGGTYTLSDAELKSACGLSPHTTWEYDFTNVKKMSYLEINLRSSL
jgi:hypothetical protein